MFEAYFKISQKNIYARISQGPKIYASSMSK